MRLNRISLFALMSVLIASGCSASRSSLRALRGGDDELATPPSHDHEYSPAPYDQDDDFQPPAPHSQPGEPVPAPPAIGVSRIKSVGWLKDLGEKIHPRPAGPAEDCVSDEELIGKCSPVESCTPEAGCATVERVQRYREHVVNGQPTDRLNPARSLKKAWGRIFYKPVPVASTDPCAGVTAESACSVPRRTVETQVDGYPEKCGEPRRSVVPQQKVVRRGETAVQLRPTRRKDCLAEPLQEPSCEEQQPGLLTPEDVEFQKHISEPPMHGPLQMAVPESPAEPTSDVPILPPMNDTDSRFEPVPEVPTIPPIADPSTKIVEPPMWPKRKGQTIRQISQPSALNWTSSNGYSTVNPMPEIVPKSRR